MAWDLLQVLGYSAPESAEMLGFADYPWRPVPEIIGMTNTQEPIPIELVNLSAEEIRQASHPDYHAWILNRQGNPGATYALRGCYHTETVQGDRVESWGVAYPVVCVASMDQGEWVVMELGAHRYATRLLPTRRFLLYGYAGEGLWISIGYQKEPFVEIRLPESGDPATLLLTMELGEIVQDRTFSAGQHGLAPWDREMGERDVPMKTRLLIAVLGVALIVVSTVQAEETCRSWYDPVTDRLITDCFGEDRDEQPVEGCTPGVHLSFIILEVSGPGVCSGVPVYVDNCTGEMLGYASEQPGTFACNLPTEENPCVVFVILVGLVIPSLPSWARGGVQAWMLGTPQPVGSDYYGEPGERPDGVFTGGRVGFEGYVGPECFVCRIPAEKGTKWKVLSSQPGSGAAARPGGVLRLGQPAEHLRRLGMGARVGSLVFAGWRSISLGSGWSDTFVFPLSAAAGLPPGDYAHPLRRMASQVSRLRPGASLWVLVKAPGGCWYAEEVRQSLRGLPLAVAVTGDPGSPPRLRGFSFCPGLFSTPVSPPPAVPDSGACDHSLQEIQALRVLARLETAYTAEVASLAGVSLPTARQALRGLKRRQLVEWEGREAFPIWKVRRAGLSLALRSWGLPPGVAFPARRERSAATGRHRRTARLWPAWLRRAWPQMEVWAGWSEVALGRLRPDALAWGELSDREVLFWLEVESGNASRETLRRKTARRLEQALLYAGRFSLSLVFALLAPPWVRQALVGTFIQLPGEVAVVLADWKVFGTLPLPRGVSAGSVIGRCVG